jgi:hypothetical protein
MNKSELLKLAGQYFISDTGSSVANLVRKIQLAEGHVDCFSTGRTRCEQTGCKWRAECLPEAPIADTEPDALAPAFESTGKQREKAK